MQSNLRPVGRRRSFIEEKRRSQIIEIAIQTIATQGFSQASLAEIAKEAGIRVAPVTVSQKGNETRIGYAAGTEMRPYMRYRIAKAMAGHFLNGILPARVNDDGAEYTQHLIDVQTNLFAAKLLAPANLIRREMNQLNVSKDVVSQLSEVFWVSKTFMNRRLKEILQGQSVL